MFGTSIETCPECGMDHVVGDVRGAPCMACSVVASMKKSGEYSDKEIEQARMYSFVAMGEDLMNDPEFMKHVGNL